MGKQIGNCMVMAGLGGCALVGIYCGIFMFRNPGLTETELFLELWPVIVVPFLFLLGGLIIEKASKP